MIIFLLVSFFLGAYFMSELPPNLRYKCTKPKLFWSTATRLQQLAVVFGFVGVIFFYLLIIVLMGWGKLKNSSWNKKA